MESESDRDQDCDSSNAGIDQLERSWGGTGASVGPLPWERGDGTVNAIQNQAENSSKWDILKTDGDIFVHNWVTQYYAKQGIQENTTDYSVRDFTDDVFTLFVQETKCQSRTT